MSQSFIPIPFTYTLKYTPLFAQNGANLANKILLVVSMILLGMWGLPHLVSVGSATYYTLYGIAALNVLVLIACVVHRVKIQRYVSENEVRIDFDPILESELRDKENLDQIEMENLAKEKIVILSDRYIYTLDDSTEHKWLVNKGWTSPYNNADLTIFDKVKYLQKRTELWPLENHFAFIRFCAQNLQNLIVLADVLCKEIAETEKVEAVKNYQLQAGDSFLTECLIFVEGANTTSLSEVFSSISDKNPYELVGVRIWNSLRWEKCVRAEAIPESVKVMALVWKISLN